MAGEKVHRHFHGFQSDGTQCHNGTLIKSMPISAVWQQPETVWYAFLGIEDGGERFVIGDQGKLATVQVRMEVLHSED